MLRTSLRSVRALGSRPIAPAVGRQWHAAVARPVVVGHRCYSDEKKPVADPASRPAAIPASETNTAASTPPPTPETPASTTIPQDGVPLTPPPAPKLEPTPTPPSPTALPPRSRPSFFRKLRNYVLAITILGAMAFGGGVWYSRINDSFHDFFTAYVPYGEQAVLYLEEMEFRKRFPNVSNRVTSRPRDAEDKVKIPAQSGASWRVADGGETGGRKSSALAKTAAAAKEAVTPSKDQPPTVNEAKKETEKLPRVNAAETAAAKKEGPHATVPVPSASKSEPAPAAPAPEATSSPKQKAFKAPEVNEPSRWPPASPIDPLNVPDAAEPVVQELVHMLNDIITVINADGANEKYGPTIGKAKNELNKVGQQIRDIKAAAEQEAAAAVKARVDEFEKAATDLVTRVEATMAVQETQWRHEFNEEIQRLQHGYQEKVKTVVERERQINEERSQNRLLEQALELQRRFAREVKKQVEEEREARLGKLKDLQSAVAELERLATASNDVVDATMRTQQLHVAVEAVRDSLDDTQQPRPFIKELVALKETATDDAVVSAAIASINPTAYQRGIPSTPELIDRFRRVANEVRKASLLPEDAGVASHASSWVLSKVMFRKQGLAEGNDVESILTRAQTYLEEGDLDNAAREVNTLTGWAKMLSRDWLGEVRKRLEVQQALEVIQTEARLQSLRVD